MAKDRKKGNSGGGPPPNFSSESKNQSKSDSAAASSSSSAAIGPSQESHDQDTEELLRNCAFHQQLLEQGKPIEARVLESKNAQAQSDSTESLEVVHQQEKPNSEKQESQKMYHQFLSFWKSISAEKRRGFLEIRVQDLKDHLIRTASPELRDSSIQDFEKAIACGRINCWEFWLCSHCDQTFTDSKSLAEHLGVHCKGAKVTKVEQVSRQCTDVPLAIKYLDQHQKQTFPNRATLLERIRDMFTELKKNRCMSSTNHTFLMRYAAKQLLTIVGQQSLRTKMAPLNQILLFLQSLSDACDSLEELPDKDGSFDDALNQVLKIEVEENIVFSEDKSRLILDESMITDSGVFIDWLFKGPSTGDAMDLWKSLKNDKRSLVAKYIQMDERTLELLHLLSETGKKLWRQEETFRSLEKTFVKEDKKRDQHASYASKDYGFLLRKTQEEIRDKIVDTILEFQTVSSLLNESQNVDIQKLESEVQSLSKIMDEVKNQKEPVSLPGQDASIMISLKQKMNHAPLERNRVHARILRISFVMKKLASKFKQVSRLDYRVLLFPLLKSFLQTSMGEQVQKYGEKKEPDDDASSLFDDKKAASEASDVKSPQATSADLLNVPQEANEEQVEKNVEQENKEAAVAAGDKLEKNVSSKVFFVGALPVHFGDE